MTTTELITRIKEDLASLEVLGTEDTLQEFEPKTDYPLGTLGRIDGTPCKVVLEINECYHCARNNAGCHDFLCIDILRVDKTSIIFKAL